MTLVCLVLHSAAWDQQTCLSQSQVLANFFATIGAGAGVRAHLLAADQDCANRLSRYPWTSIEILQDAPHAEPALGDCVALGIDLSNPGDSLYVVHDDQLHAPGALTAISEGLFDTSADYITLYDDPHTYWSYGPSTARTEATSLSVTYSCHWARVRRMRGGFAAWRGTLVDDRNLWRSVGCGEESGWIWDALIEQQRVLLGVIPAFSTRIGKTDLAPCRDWWSLVEPDSTRALPMMSPPCATIDDGPVAVFPGISGATLADLGMRFPRSRIVPVATVEEAIRESCRALVIPASEKENVDAIIMYSSTIEAVFVQMDPASPPLALRWLSGRDWCLPVGELWTM